MEYLNNDSYQKNCLNNANLEFVKALELNYKNSDFNLGGFSAIDYIEKTDQLFLLSDSPKGYVVRLNSFSSLINSSDTKIDIEKDDILKFKYNIWQRFFNKGDGEGLRIKGNYFFVLNEKKYWSWRSPFANSNQPPTFQKYYLKDGKRIKNINLPNSFMKDAFGNESLALSKNGLFLVANEGNIPNIKFHDPNFGPFLKIISRFYKFKTENKVKAFNQARYLTINKNLEISDVSTFSTGGGKLRDLYIAKEQDILLALTSNYLVKGFKLKEMENKIVIKDQIFKWKIPLKEKWEGITKGPNLKKRTQSLLFVNDNDFEQPYSKNRKNVPNIVSVFSINIKNKCLKQNYRL